MKNQRRKEVFTLIVVFAGVVILSALIVYYVGGARRVTPEPVRQTATPQQQQPEAVLGMPDERTPAAPQTARHAAWQALRPSVRCRPHGPAPAVECPQVQLLVPHLPASLPAAMLHPALCLFQAQKLLDRSPLLSTD